MRILLTALLLLPAFASAQTSREEIYAAPEKAGGVYYAYPTPTATLTPPPDGYEPFYASHYGRHGSRYVITDASYEKPLEALEMAKMATALTPYGEDILVRLDSVYAEAQGRGGELTPLGYRQHRGIAERMYHNYPQLFADDADITAVSSTTMRCAHSMFAFVDALRSLNPKLHPTLESSKRHMHYMKYTSPQTKERLGSREQVGTDSAYYSGYFKFEYEKNNPDRMMREIFADSAYVKANVDPRAFMRQMYWIAVDMQNVETPISLFDMFTPDELFDHWEIHNYDFYLTNGSHPGSDGMHVDDAKNLLKNILETADEYVANGKTGATLRFGHDGNLVPLAALMQMPGCAVYEADPNVLYKSFANFQIIPMAGNIQIVFYRNSQDDVICKFLLNEEEVSIPAPTDIYPYYRWIDARATLQHLLDTPSKTFMR